MWQKIENIIKWLAKCFTSDWLNVNIIELLNCFGRIKNDDKMIRAEGMESLSESELRHACRDRGLLGVLSVEEMRQQVSGYY